MSKTIYVVTSGCYSDYHIEAVFTDKALAEEFRAAGAPTAYDDGRSIEEFEADPVAWRGPQGMKHWRVEMQKDGNEATARVYPLDSRGSTTTDTFWDGRSYRPHPNMVAYMWARDEEHAIKIANERRIARLASGRWEDGP